MFRLLRHMPLFRLLAIGKTVLLAHHHVMRLSKGDRRRLAQLVRRGPAMSRRERDELRRILGKLEPRAFAFATADAFSPLPIPRRIFGR